LVYHLLIHPLLPGANNKKQQQLKNLDSIH
jgi:hypothetical protein